jgi:hypothetical protein
MSAQEIGSVPAFRQHREIIRQTTYNERKIVTVRDLRFAVSIDLYGARQRELPLPSLGVSSLDLGRSYPRAALFLRHSAPLV